MPSLVKYSTGSSFLTGSLALARASLQIVCLAFWRVPVIWLVSIPAHCKAVIVSAVLVLIPAHCKELMVLAVFMPALMQFRVIFLMIVLGEAGHMVETAAALPVNDSLASVMERKGGGWAVIAELVTAVMLVTALPSLCLTLDMLE